MRNHCIPSTRRLETISRIFAFELVSDIRAILPPMVGSCLLA
jgi:hypothetical protein